MSVIANNLSSEPSWSFVDSLLREQQQTTAVEKFSQWHEDANTHHQEKYYRNLIPLAAPKPGEQYAFEVDLDACSGCKACVVACHTLNGLEDTETWRQVGLLHGGTVELPVLQHVTSACHHCVDPACLEGCPVNAYEKDVVTGIVRHLDDQCIGCQYCILKCPYDVPKYSPSKGIIRKCDMCQNRLAVGEAPACVQSCPNHAIRITIVSQRGIVDESEADLFLPGAPEPSYTYPTTVYKTERRLPRNLLPADYYSARPSHGHLPLVFMLVLTQLSVGAFCVQHVLTTYFPWFNSDAMASVRSVHLGAALAAGFLGLGSSVLHLGRPLYAFRAMIGLRTSWLSREILAFSLFAGFASTHVALAFGQNYGWKVAPWIEQLTANMAAFSGLFGIFCSIMIYADTRRPFWNGTFTSVKFFMTAIVLGVPASLLVSLCAAAATDSLTLPKVMEEYGVTLCNWLVVAATAKLVFEGLFFMHLRPKQHTPLKRTALLMCGELALTTMRRFFFGVVGGILLPGLLMMESVIGPSEGFNRYFIGFAVLLSFISLLVGELIERFLFFSACVAPKMPGSLP